MKKLIFAGLGAILFAPFSLAAGAQADLEKLAAGGDGLIRLNQATFDVLTSPKRSWSASILFTALDPRRRCHPCTFVLSGS